jgi:nitrate reductase gamma subunit
VAGIIAAAFGTLFLLYLFIGNSMLPPELTGAAWWAAVLRAMVSPGAIAGTAIGITLVVGGILLMLRRSPSRSSFVSIAAAAVIAVLILLVIILS